ncbi:MAG: hypothetical protein ACLTBV_31955 [Enterocloster bolteae]
MDSRPRPLPLREAMYQSAVNSTGGVLGTAAGTNGAQYGWEH